MLGIEGAPQLNPTLPHPSFHSQLCVYVCACLCVCLSVCVCLCACMCVPCFCVCMCVACLCVHVCVSCLCVHVCVHVLGAGSSSPALTSRKSGAHVSGLLVHACRTRPLSSHVHFPSHPPALVWKQSGVWGEGLGAGVWSLHAPPQASQNNTNKC